MHEPIRDLPVPEDFPTVRGHLPNGPALLVHSDPSKSVASCHLFVQAGSRDDPNGRSGLSHFLEHLVFVEPGSSESGNGATSGFDRRIEEVGGDSNAYTSHDLTVFHEAFPPAALETVLDLVWRRFRPLAATEGDFEAERRIILEERRAELEDAPAMRMLEELYALSFREHPYGRPIIGLRPDLEALSLEDCRGHHARHYAPRNAVLVVAGPWPATAAIERVMRSWEAARIDPPPSAPPATACAAEPPQTTVRRGEVVADAGFAAAYIGYRTPARDHDDLVPLDVASAVLGEGRLSRIHRAVVEGSEEVLDYELDMDELQDPGLFTVYLQGREGVDAATLIDAFDRVLQALIDAPPEERELARIRKRMLVDHWHSMRTVSGRAELFGQYEVELGDWRDTFRVPADYDSVTPDDVKRVVERYLDPGRRSVVTLRPPRSARRAESGPRSPSS